MAPILTSRLQLRGKGKYTSTMREGTIWSGNPYSLPSTTGFVFFDPALGGNEAGDVEAGNNCLCAPPKTAH